MNLFCCCGGRFAAGLDFYSHQESFSQNGFNDLSPIASAILTREPNWFPERLTRVPFAGGLVLPNDPYENGVAVDLPAGPVDLATLTTGDTFTNWDLVKTRRSGDQIHWEFCRLQFTRLASGSYEGAPLLEFCFVLTDLSMNVLYVSPIHTKVAPGGNPISPGDLWDATYGRYTPTGDGLQRLDWRTGDIDDSLRSTPINVRDIMFVVPPFASAIPDVNPPGHLDAEAQAIWLDQVGDYVAFQTITIVDGNVWGQERSGDERPEVLSKHDHRYGGKGFVEVVAPDEVSATMVQPLTSYTAKLFGGAWDAEGKLTVLLEQVAASIPALTITTPATVPPPFMGGHQRFAAITFDALQVDSWLTDYVQLSEAKVTGVNYSYGGDLEDHSGPPPPGGFPVLPLYYIGTSVSGPFGGEIPDEEYFSAESIETRWFNTGSFNLAGIATTDNGSVGMFSPFDLGLSLAHQLSQDNLDAGRVPLSVLADCKKLVHANGTRALEASTIAPGWRPDDVLSCTDGSGDFVVHERAFGATATNYVKDPANASTSRGLGSTHTGVFWDGAAATTKALVVAVGGVPTVTGATSGVLPLTQRGTAGDLRYGVFDCPRLEEITISAAGMLASLVSTAGWDNAAGPVSIAIGTTPPDLAGTGKLAVQSAFNYFNATPNSEADRFLRTGQGLPAAYDSFDFAQGRTVGEQRSTLEPSPLAITGQVWDAPASSLATIGATWFADAPVDPAGWSLESVGVSHRIRRVRANGQTVWTSRAGSPPWEINDQVLMVRASQLSGEDIAVIDLATGASTLVNPLPVAETVVASSASVDFSQYAAVPVTDALSSQNWPQRIASNRFSPEF